MGNISNIEQLASEIEELQSETGEVIDEAILTESDWEEYYREVERIRQASLTPDAGRIIVRNIH
jgi:hypothetical protein